MWVKTAFVQQMTIPALDRRGQEGDFCGPANGFTLVWCWYFRWKNSSLLYVGITVLLRGNFVGLDHCSYLCWAWYYYWDV